MAVSQTLSVTEVAGSPSVANNTSKVRILWKSTQTGESHNLNTRTAKYYVSINGGAEKEYSVSYTLPLETTKTIVDVTITVPHKDDGSGTVKVRTWMDTRISAGVVEKSQTITLTTIARASAITSAANITIGNKCSVKWTPKSKAFRYKLKFSIGDWSLTTGAIHPNTTSAYTYASTAIPMLVADQLPNAVTGTMTVKLYTYSDSAATKQVGSADTATFTVTVPGNSDTLPEVEMELTPQSSLGSAFSSLYIQGKTKVKASLSAEGQYEATIKSYSMKVEGKTYDADDSYTSGYLSQYGNITVEGYAKDSRGYTGKTIKSIPVIAYSKPQISNVVAARCDASGNLSDSGTYLKIKAKRSYSPVKVDGVQKNFCKIRYRYKAATASSYSSWVTILASDDLISNSVETGALLGGALAIDTTYMVQVQAIDDIGESSSTTIKVPTDRVYWHRDGARRSFTFGGYVEEDNTFAIAEDIQFKVKSEKWVSLGLTEDVSDSTSNCGRAGAGCFYRVVNGNHVYIAFNCAFSYAGTPVYITANLPAKYCPARNVYTMCATGGRAIARVLVTKNGEVIVDWIQVLSSADATTESTVSWIDGYIDYFVDNT